MMIHVDKIIKGRGLEKGGRAQKYVDNAVLMYCSPLTPRMTGELIQSSLPGRGGTVIGSGIIKYTAKHARKNYYENKGLGKEGVNKGEGQRGRLWFRIVKTRYKGAIFNGLKKEVRKQ